MGKGGKEGGRLTSGDRSSRREERQGETEKERWEAGRALLKGNVLNVHRRCS